MHPARRENIRAAIVVLVYIAQSAVLVGSVNIRHGIKEFGPASWDPNKFLQQLSQIQERDKNPINIKPQTRFQELTSSLESFAKGNHFVN